MNTDNLQSVPKRDVKAVEIKLEHQLSNYLDGRYNFDFSRNDFNTVIGKKQQLEGIDLIVTDEYMNEIYIDEKARFSYINNDSLPTFVFELDFVNRNNEHTIGWFIDEKNRTVKYHLITRLTTDIPTDRQKDIYKKVYNNGMFNGTINFTNALIRSLDKQDFLKELEALHLPINRIDQHYRWRVRDCVEKYCTNIKLLNSDDTILIKQKLKDIDGVQDIEINTFENGNFKEIKVFVYELKGRIGWFHYTHHLPEKPINLVIKDNLINKPESTFIL